MAAGQYEIASYVNDKFQKLDDVTYIFWECRVREDRVGLKLRQACKYQYVGDVLLIRSARMKFNSQAQHIFDDEMYIVSPTHRSIMDKEARSFNAPSLNSRYLCSYYLVHNNDKILAIYTQVDFVGNGNPPPIKFEDTADGITFGFDASRQFIHDKIYEDVKHLLK